MKLNWLKSRYIEFLIDFLGDIQKLKISGKSLLRVVYKLKENKITIH